MILSNSCWAFWKKATSSSTAETAIILILSEELHTLRAKDSTSWDAEFQAEKKELLQVLH